MPNKRLIWSEQNSVNDPEMDAHHQHLCEIGNNILDLVEAGQAAPDRLLTLLTEMGDYIFYHFKTEENYLKKLNFPQAEKHIQSHERYRQEVQSFIKEVRERQQMCKQDEDCRIIANDIAEFVYDWISNHMLGGTETEKFFRQKKS